MLSFFPKISLKFVLSGFKSFIKDTNQFSNKEKKETLLLLENKTIQTIFHLSFIQIFWSVCVFFIDSFLISRTTIVLLVGKGFWNAALPTFIFLVLNASIKFFFIKWFIHGKIKIETKYILLGVIPTLGSFLLATYLLSEQKTFLRVMKTYLKKVRKNFFYFHLNK